MGLEPPPLPLSADWYPATQTLLVTFDQPLQPNPTLNPGNWAMQYNPTWRQRFFNATAPGGPTVVITNPQVPEFQAGPVGIRFDPPPFDVLNVAGTPAAAFSALSYTTH